MSVLLSKTMFLPTNFPSNVDADADFIGRFTAQYIEAAGI